MLKIRIFYFFALAFVGIGYYSTAGLQGKQPRIIKGTRCHTNNVPYFVFIEIHITEEHSYSLCGGSLLTYEWVLTAAHCVHPFFRQGGTVKVYSAFDMPSQLKQIRNAKEIHTHPNFVAKDFKSARDRRYDIALMLVDQPFRQTVATRVATLPVPGFAKKCNQVMTPGIGETYNKEKLKNWLHRPLMCATVNIYNANSCKRDFSNANILFDDTIMCMLQQDKGPCRGDSGGPVLCDNVVIGLVSAGSKDCKLRQRPTTFTMVEKYLDFLENFIHPSNLTFLQ